MNAGGLPATMLCNINLWLVVLVINTWDCAEPALNGKLSKKKLSLPLEFNY
jgi:hypothetical protein